MKSRETEECKEIQPASAYPEKSRETEEYKEIQPASAYPEKKPLEP